MQAIYAGAKPLKLLETKHRETKPKTALAGPRNRGHIRGIDFKEP
jgi:hypothetical protein